MKAIVKFSCGKNHPLFNLPVEAEILPCCGYDRMQVDGTTISRIYFPENDKGYAVFNKGELVCFRKSPAYVKHHNGYVSEIFDEQLGKWVSAREYWEYITYKRLKQKFEKTEV